MGASTITAAVSPKHGRQQDANGPEDKPIRKISQRAPALAASRRSMRIHHRSVLGLGSSGVKLSSTFTHHYSWRASENRPMMKIGELVKDNIGKMFQHCESDPLNFYAS